MKRPTISLLLSALVLVTVALPAFSQEGRGRGRGRGHSDDEGGGRGDDNIVGIRAAVLAPAILSAQRQVVTGLNARSIEFAPASIEAKARVAASANVAKLFGGAPGTSESTQQLTTLFAKSGVPATKTADMLQSIADLGTLSSRDDGVRVEARVRIAASKFNDFVSDASSDFLMSPPPEFIVLRRSLAPFVRALSVETASSR